MNPHRIGDEIGQTFSGAGNGADLFRFATDCDGRRTCPISPPASARRPPTRRVEASRLARGTPKRRRRIGAEFDRPELRDLDPRAAQATLWNLARSKLPPRASWKGFLKIAEVTCPVALYAAASTSERIALHTDQPRDGQPGAPAVRRRRDRQAGRDATTRSRDTRSARTNMSSSSPTKSPRAVPQSDKTLAVSAFIDLARRRRRLFRPALLSRAFGPERRRGVRA